jgi:choline-sulfatase
MAKPNVLFICSDQHSFRFSGYAGHPLVQTPNLDRLAASGTVFESAYCGSPVCVPSRACLATGMYPSDSSSFCNSTVWDGSQPVWATYLQDAGYRCRAVGKLDLNDDFATGFDEIRTSHGHRHRPDITSLFRRPPIYRVGEREGVDGRSRVKRHSDEKTAETAIEFIHSADSQPWATWVGFNQPHSPFIGLQKYYDLYPPDDIDMPREEDLEKQHLVYQALRHFKRVANPIPEDRVRRARSGYYAMVTELDEYIGRLMDAVESAGQVENTIVIYTSDHGETLGEHGLWYKNNLFEDAAHIPLVVSGPGIPSGQRIDTIVSHVDLIATLLEWADAPPPEGLRGHSLTSLLGGDGQPHPGFAYTESHSEGNVTGSYMIRKEEWKYIYFTWYEPLLFNLKDDPGETRNRAEDPECQPILRELDDILRAQVDPDALTRKAFEAQDQKLAEIASGKTEEELAAVFESRLGPGLARVMASRHAVR